MCSQNNSSKWVLRWIFIELGGAMVMKKKENNKKNDNTWILLDEKRKVLFSSDNVADVFQKGQEYPYGKVVIEQRFKPDTCYF